jgi:hypothetical protein
VKGFFLLLMSLFPFHKVGRLLSSGVGDANNDSYKRCPGGGFSAFQDETVFSPFLKIVGSMNGDISILA